MTAIVGTESHGGVLGPQDVPGIRIENVIIGERARKDYGDLTSLKESILEHGLLQPIVVLPDDYLLCGGRRLEACRQLGWAAIPFVRSSNQGDAMSRVKAERDENTCRKDMTPSELVGIGKLLETLKRPEAEERQHLGQIRGGEVFAGREASGSSGPEASSERRIRDEVAEAIGMTRSTYARASSVITTAEDETADPVVRQVAIDAQKAMDAGTISISGAATKVAHAKQDILVVPVVEAKAAERPEHLRKTRHINADRVIETTVMDASNLVVPGLMSQINFANLTKDKLGGWVSSLSESIRALQALKRTLEKELTHGGV